MLISDPAVVEHRVYLPANMLTALVLVPVLVLVLVPLILVCMPMYGLRIILMLWGFAPSYISRFLALVLF